MKRRDLLAGVVFTTSGLAGCLRGPTETDEIGDSETNINADSGYERCGNSIVPVHLLPDPAKDEAITAIEGEKYETDSKLVLPEAVTINESYLARSKSDGYRYNYYSMIVETNEGTSQLRAEKILPRTSAVKLVNDLEDDLALDIRLEHEGDLLIEKTVNLSAGEDTELNDDVQYRYGDYRAEVEVHNIEGLENEEITWWVDESRFQAEIVISSREGIVPHQGVVEAMYCKWNDDGILVSGTKAP